LRGDIAYQERRYAAAARAFREAVALGDEGTWSLVGLARSYAHAGDKQAARGAAAEAAERAPGEPGGWLVLGEIALRDRQFADAERFLSRAHEASPKDKYVYSKLVEARIAELPVDSQVREVETLLKTTAKANPHLQRVLARLQKAQGRPDAAADTLARALRESGDLRSRKDYAFSLKKAARVDEAAAALAQCLAEDPEDVVVFTHYVHVQKGRGALDELRGTLEALLPTSGRRYGAFLGELKKLPTG
jgi:tetratricopeptide (TPR) repeat protein